jgi:hypothetical protein
MVVHKPHRGEDRSFTPADLAKVRRLFDYDPQAGIEQGVHECDDGFELRDSFRCCYEGDQPQHALNSRGGRLSWSDNMSAVVRSPTLIRRNCRASQLVS